MYSLSVLAKLQGWTFDYYVDHIASFLQENPHGNYKYALENGMQILEEKFTVDGLQCSDDVLFIPEGGYCSEAEYGLSILAKEIDTWAEEKNIKDLKIFLPSGTGTTALYLQKHSQFPVFTSACVGDENYLKKEFEALESAAFHPTILGLGKKYHFGKLYPEFYDIWIKLTKETGVTFDLLYDPKGWLTLLAHLSLLGENILYIHQGGLIGNESMLQRYKRKYKR